MLVLLYFYHTKARFFSVQTLSLREVLERDKVPGNQASPSCAPHGAPTDCNPIVSQSQHKQSRDSNTMKP